MLGKGKCYCCDKSTVVVPLRTGVGKREASPTRRLPPSSSWRWRSSYLLFSSLCRLQYSKLAATAVHCTAAVGVRVVQTHHLVFCAAITPPQYRTSSILRRPDISLLCVLCVLLCLMSCFCLHHQCSYR